MGNDINAPDRHAASATHAEPLSRAAIVSAPLRDDPSPHILEDVPLNTADIPRHELDISCQTRANPLPWKGQFSPQLIEALLRRYAAPGSHVFDPFLGSGTVLAECIRRQLDASGSEVNPAASILSRLYTLASLRLEDRRSACDAAFKAVERHLSQEPLTASSADLAEVRPQDIATLARQQSDSNVATIMTAALVLADPTWSSLSIQRLIDALRRVRQLLLTLPAYRASITVFDSDARRIPLPDSSIDLIVTSPPYINVFNYHQQYRPAVEALDIDVLEAARSEIGSNRKHRMNRFLTVVQYCLDMASVLREMKRLLRPGGRMIFVVGRESRVRGVPILNGALLSAIATESVDLVVRMRQERAFTNRFGERIVEDILHMFLPVSPSLPSSSPTAVADRVLNRLVETAHGEVREDIEAAIGGIAKVLPSPLYAGISG